MGHIGPTALPHLVGVCAAAATGGHHPISGLYTEPQAPCYTHGGIGARWEQAGRASSPPAPWRCFAPAVLSFYSSIISWIYAVTKLLGTVLYSQQEMIYRPGESEHRLALSAQSRALSGKP